MSVRLKIRALEIVTMGTLGVLGLMSCAKDAEQVKVTRAPGAPGAPGATNQGETAKGTPKPGDPPIAFTNQEAAAFVKSTCGACHEKGQAYQSFWSFEKDKFSAETFAVDPSAYKVYQAVKLKSLGRQEGPPAPMPPGPASEEAKFASSRFLLWVKKEVPDVLLEAHANYPDATGASDLKVVFDFKCSQPVTYRQFIRRVTNDAFEREPLPNELSWAGNSPDVPTSKELREMVAAKFREDSNWATDFKNKTLRKFTDKIASVTEIQAGAGISAGEVEDIRQEFYQLVRKKSGSTSWRDLLLSDSVMVTSRTAKFYEGECASTPPPAGEWAECQMQAPRGSFFTTMGYLLSKRTSFLETNNNYGRAALMNLVITGELLSAATNGPKGETDLRPLPSCLKTRDIRGTLSGENFSPYGSAAVPLFGNVCQSCHISRHMAAGSLLFRPFSTTGLLFKPEQIVATDEHVAEAIKAGQVYLTPGSDVRTPVDIDFLKSLLAQDGNEQACLIPKAGETEPEIITSVKALAERIAANDRDLAKGLARHVPRALSNLSTTTLEIQNRMIDAYEKSGGKLSPLIESYFSSETYACEKRE